MIAELVAPTGRVIALDRDATALSRAAAAIDHPCIQAVHASYSQTRHVLDELEIECVDGMLLDLGLSSDQLADPERGFSFRSDGPLDLRFDTEMGATAADLLARLPEEEIANLIYQFGEERFSRRIAKKIVESRRRKNPIRTTSQLADLVRSCVPRSKNHAIDPATRTFQALRIAVNEELRILQTTLEQAKSWIRPGGVMVVISFHSLEDRIVKNAFRDASSWKIITKKPIVGSDEEIATNPRARSAKLRVATVAEPSNESPFHF